MRKLASTTVLLAAAIGLTACGGSDNQAFVGTGTSSTTGTGTTRSGVTGFGGGGGFGGGAGLGGFG